MANAPSTQTSEAHDAEAAKQAAIAAEVDDAAASKTVVGAETTPVVEDAASAPEQPLVTLQPKADVELDFPIAVSVVGAEDDLIFTGPSATVEVPAPVAEQITYSPAVEVAA